LHWTSSPLPSPRFTTKSKTNQTASSSVNRTSTSLKFHFRMSTASEHSKTPRRSSTHLTSSWAHPPSRRPCCRQPVRLNSLKACRHRLHSNKSATSSLPRQIGATAMVPSTNVSLSSSCNSATSPATANTPWRSRRRYSRGSPLNRSAWSAEGSQDGLPSDSYN